MSQDVAGRGAGRSKIGNGRCGTWLSTCTNTIQDYHEALAMTGRTWLPDLKVAQPGREFEPLRRHQVVERQTVRLCIQQLSRCGRHQRHAHADHVHVHLKVHCSSTRARGKGSRPRGNAPVHHSEYTPAPGSSAAATEDENESRIRFTTEVCSCLWMRMTLRLECLNRHKRVHAAPTVMRRTRVAPSGYTTEWMICSSLSPSTGVNMRSILHGNQEIYISKAHYEWHT